jgi:RHS repeat-associated protein
MNRRVRKTVRRYDGMGWSDQDRHSFVWDGWNIVLEQIDVGGSTAHVIEYYWGEDFSGTEQGAGNAPVAKRSGRLSEANPKGRKGPRVGGLLAVSYDGEFYVPIYGGNGNIMGYVDESGAFAAKFEYDPYGDVVSIEDVLSAPMPSLDGSPVPIPVGLRGEDFSFGFSTKYHDREVDLIAYQLRSYSPRLGRWVNRDPIEEEGGLNLYAFCDNDAIASIDSLELSKYWDNYMRYYVHDSSDVWKAVGGNLYWQHLTDEGYENSCALRVSRALVNSGESIPIAPGRWVAKDYTVKEDTASRQGITFKKGTVLKAEKPGSRYELSAEKMKGCLDSVITGDKLKEKKMLLQNSKAVKYAESIENCNDEAFFVGYSTEGWWHTGMIKKDYKDHYLFTRNLMYVTFWRLKK